MTIDPVHPMPHRRPRRRIAVALIVAATALLGPSAPPAGAADPATSDEWIALTYRTCLHRDPDPAGLEFWSERWGVPDVQGGAQRVTTAICFGEESLGATITDTFDWTLDRAPSADDRAYWTPRVRNRGNLHLVERHMLASAERYAASGGTDVMYVSDLYGRVLDRPASPGDITYWVGRLGSGEPRARTVDALLGSTEAHVVRVERLAAATVERAPSQDELDNSTYMLRTFQEPRLATTVFLEWVALLVP